mmetsp:Transcript_4138/g.8859  ORF Transcript_4138/g.8859 Transcript_4138/m.8859 type:complete len:86 (+) Transcript_4138:373-630(+)
MAACREPKLPLDPRSGDRKRKAGDRRGRAMEVVPRPAGDCSWGGSRGLWAGDLPICGREAMTSLAADGLALLCPSFSGDWGTLPP